MSRMTPEWQRQHKLVRKARGKASEYDCHCGRPAREWSWVHDTDRWDVNNYRPMCKRCHVRYDHKSMAREMIPETRAKVSAALVGIKRSDETKQRLSNSWSNGTRNKEAIGRKISRAKTGVKRTPEQIERVRKARWGK